MPGKGGTLKVFSQHVTVIAICADFLDLEAPLANKILNPQELDIYVLEAT